jgi:hypothetical protein
VGLINCIYAYYIILLILPYRYCDILYHLSLLYLRVVYYHPLDTFVHVPCHTSRTVFLHVCVLYNLCASLYRYLAILQELSSLHLCILHNLCDTFFRYLAICQELSPSLHVCILYNLCGTLYRYFAIFQELSVSLYTSFYNIYFVAVYFTMLSVTHVVIE